MEHDYTRDQVVGSFLAGAVGDALGGGVEFDSWSTIEAAHGPGGIREYVPAYGRLGAITDDTQMTLFTAEGLIRAATRHLVNGHCHTPTVVHHAYLRWLATQQGLNRASATRDHLDGWLIGVEELWARRAPGNTCLTALESGRMGEVATAINDSKGCGGVMRAAPAGLAPPSRRFDLGCEVAAITHSHPDGIYPGGALAVIVGALFDGEDLASAVHAAETELSRPPRAAATLAALRAGREVGSRGLPSVADLEALGCGWVGEEALAIAVACAIGSYDRPGRALVASVNHSGDSDSTGSICGNILGAAHGTKWLLPSWLEHLELRDVITQIARDGHRALHIGVPTDADHHVDPLWLQRYPAT